MSNKIYLWMLTEEVKINSHIQETIVKICNIGEHLFLLTANNNLYRGLIEKDCNQKYHTTLEHVNNLKPIDIDCCKENIFIVNTEGTVLKCNDKLDVLEEIILLEEFRCSKGHCGTKSQVKVKNIAVGDYGQLFVTKLGHLWGCGYMPQIGLNTDIPKQIEFFTGRFIHSINVGNDFAIATVSKHKKSEDIESDDDEALVQHCPKCLSASQLTSPVSQYSISDICPLGIKVKGSYDIETTSTSSKNDTSISSTDIKEDDKLSDKCEIEKNIIFRNTEAAREFLSRQISRMSLVGEEYLVECTEKPTRIIKENVTNVASLVYEGVKNVGDKVATLSRHVSGSSECNSVLGTLPLEDSQMPRSSSKDEFILSISQCTSERDIFEKGIQDRVNIILSTGANLLNCEVWTWGNIVHGQLDIQEDLLSFLPSDLSESKVNPILQIFNKITGSSYKYNLPTSPSGIGDSIKRERPMIITKLSNIGVFKTSVQCYHAAVLTIDGRAFIWGQNDHNQVTVENNVDQTSPRLFLTTQDERVRDIVCGAHYTAVLTSSDKIVYFGKGSAKPVTLHSPDNQVKNGNVFLYKNLLSTMQYTLLNVVQCEGKLLTKFLIEEQQTLEEMLSVQLYIIKPLQKKTSNSSNQVLFDSLCKNYTDLLYFSCLNVQSICEHTTGIIPFIDITMFKFYEEHLFLYNKYLTIVQNILSISGFNSISKLIDVSQNLYKLRPDMFNKRDKNSEEQIISLFLLLPIYRISSYRQLIDQYCNVKDTIAKWHIFAEEFENKHKEAENTRQFWLNSGKNVETLKNPDRRLIRDSHKQPIGLQNAGRFSSHWFLLFNDIFAHINGSSVNVHNLTMIWIEPQQDESNTLHQICLKMPEDSLVLVTSEAESKIEWFHTLQQAIKIALNKPDALQPPVVRSGTYTFTKSGFFKDATYTGRWLNGKMQGSGKLQWSDGRVYTGQFSNNTICGYGIMHIPSVGSYEGYWKDNQQNGLGTFTYSNTDMYKGHFKDGVPHGHGFIRKGNFTSNNASVYIGDWVSGTKCGYGVMDDILTGEKYIGSWQDDKRHGNGLIVTSELVYYEGVFNQDVLTGHGIMILEDGSYYEGEFKGTGTLNGKGTLTLPSGHTIEGTLTGSYSDSIKINNGTLIKNNDVSKLPKSFQTLCVLPDQKWKALFRHCHQVLGIPENNLVKNGTKTIDTQKIWQNVAIYLSNATTLKKSREGDGKLYNSLNNLDIIPPYGRDAMTLHSYLEIKNYLIKAFDSNFHPLGTLLNNLSEAYTTTYSGKVHPLLLPHAISELIDVTKRIYEIVRYLFPALPLYGKECLLEDNHSEEIVNYQSILYPVILPKVHNSLFTLLTLKNESQERHYKKSLMEWNKQSDNSLMRFLSVDSKFIKTDNPENPPKRMYAFIEAIETLQQIKSMFTPTEKLVVIRETIEKMTPVAQTMLGESYVWNMDDLFPLFLHVVVRARIPDLGAELEFIEKFMDPGLENGELGIMFTTLKACYQQILQEKGSIF